MKPSLVRVDGKNLNECLEFLKPREHRAISLASHLVADGRPRPAIRDFFAIPRALAGGIEGLILLTETGILFHCLDGVPQSHADLLSRRLAPLGVKCILGAEPGTTFLEGLLDIRATRTVEYRLMTATGTEEPGAFNPLEGLSAGDGGEPHIRQCDPSDAPLLLPLQEGYEREEVIPPGNPFSREACLAGLSRALATQYVYAAFYGQQPAAKAGTNACGFAWDQLGGVYTSPVWRGKGIAAALVTHVVRQRMKTGKKVALFVKTDNRAAIRVYEKTGFKPDIPFRISYF